MTGAEDQFPLERVRQELARRGHDDWDHLRIIKALGTAGFFVTFAHGMAFVYEYGGRATVQTCADQCELLAGHDFGDGQTWLSYGVEHDDANFSLH